MSATYSGPFSLPSILKQPTPASMSEGTISTAIRSCGDSRYFTSPISRSAPSTTSPYGSRHACAHCPRLALRPPHASLLKHCPLYETHSAPCTNASTSASVPCRTAAISRTLSSRPTTTRLHPSSRANSAPSGLVMLICVEPWMVRPGAVSRTKLTRPTSWTMTASTPALAIDRTRPSACVSSSSNTSTFMVTKPRAPRACRKDITSGSSSTSKLAARARAFSRFRPKYTASAPASTAARICGHPPAGARISGFTISRGPCAGPAEDVEAIDDSKASAAVFAEPSYNDGFLRFSAASSVVAARSAGTRALRARYRARGATEAPGYAKAVESMWECRGKVSGALFIQVGKLFDDLPKPKESAV